MRDIKSTYRLVKFILPILSIALIISFCKKEEEESSSDNQVHTFVFNPDELWMSEEGNGFFEFTIDPPIEANWAIGEKPDWLNLSPTIGSMAFGETQKINVSVGDYNGQGGSLLFNIKFGSDVCDSAQTRIRLETGFVHDKIKISPENLLMPGDVNDTSFLLTNAGSTAFSFTIEDIPEHITLSQTEGILHPDNPLKINLHANRSDLDSLINISGLVIKNSLDQEKNLKITIQNEYEEGIWDLPFIIKDAEYSYSMDKIIAIAENEHLLFVLDPINRTWLQIDLPKLPLCVSVSPDGRFAAVGYNAFCSYIDLENSTVETYQLNMKVFDIILASNKWIYVFADDVGGYYDGIQCINTTSGDLIQVDGYLSDAKESIIRLHPSENYIYSRQTSSSSSRMTKYDISSDTLNILYYKYIFDIESYMDYFWITKEGERILTQFGNVLSSTDNEETDLEYQDSFLFEKGMRWLDDKPSDNLICALIYSSQTQWNANNMFTFSFDDLSQLDTFELPKYTKPGNNILYEPNGQFVFIKDDGSKAWVIMQAGENFQDPYSWRIIGFDL